MVQVYSVCQAYLHVKMYCSSISFIIQLWIPWGIPKQNSCQSETRILSAPMATYSGQKPYKKSLLSFVFFLLAFAYTYVGFLCFPFVSACCFSQSYDEEQEKAWLPGADDNQQSGGESEMWKWSPLQEPPNTVRYFGHSSALLGCLNSTQRFYPVLAFTFACIDWIRKLSQKWNPLQVWKDTGLGFGKA